MVTITGCRRRRLGRDECGSQRSMLGPICILLITSILPVSAQDAANRTDELFYGKPSVLSENPSVTEPASDNLGVPLTTEFDDEKLLSSATEQKKKHGKPAEAKKAPKKKKKKKMKKYQKAKRAKDGTMHCHYREYIDDAETEAEMSTATGRNNNERLLSHHDPAFALNAFKDAVNAPSPSPPVWRRQVEGIEIVSPEASTSEEPLHYRRMQDQTSQNEDGLGENVVDEAAAETLSTPHAGHVSDVAPAPIDLEEAQQTPPAVSASHEVENTVQKTEDPDVSDEAMSQTIPTQLQSDEEKDAQQENPPPLASNQAPPLDAEETATEPDVTEPEKASTSTVGAILSVSEKRTDEYGDYREVVQICPPGFDNSCSDLKFSAFDESVAYESLTVDMSLVMEIENGTILDIEEINQMLAAAVLEDIRTCGTRRFLKLEDAGASEESMPRRLLNTAVFSKLDAMTSKRMVDGTISVVEETTEAAFNETNSNITSDASETSTRICFEQHQMKGSDTECTGMNSSWRMSIIPDPNNSNVDEIKIAILRIINRLCASGKFQQKNIQSCSILKAPYVDQGAIFEAEVEGNSFSQIQSIRETKPDRKISPPGIALIACFGVGLLAVVLVGIHKGRAKYKEMKTSDEWNGKDGPQRTDVESTLASNTPRNADDLYSPTFSSGSALDGKAIVQDLQCGDGGYEIPFALDTEQDDNVSL